MAKTESDYITKINAVKTGYLDGLWDSGDSRYEESTVPFTWLNAGMLQTISILAGKGEASGTDITRAGLVVDALFGVNCYNAGGNGTWRATLNGTITDIHESQDAVVAEALYYAWKYRTELSLSAGQITSITNALTVNETTTLYGGNTLDITGVKDNQSLGKWMCNRLTFGKLLIGDTTFDADLSTCMKNFIDYMDTNYGTPNTGSNPLTGLFADYGWRYVEVMEEWPSFEYGAMCLGGSLIYYPEISSVVGLTAGEILSMKAWERRILGEWTHSGYPNWDTVWSWGRLHISQYWIWSLRSLIGIARNVGLNQGASDHEYAKYMLDAAIDTHTLMDTWNSDASDGAIAKDPYGVTHTGIVGESYNVAKSVANSKFVSELATAVELSIPAVTSTAPGNLWTYSHTDKAVHVSTQSYSGCSLPNAPTVTAVGWTGPDSVQCQHWGISRIASANGRILTSLGGYAQEAFSLQIYEGAVLTFDTSATAPDTQRVSIDDADIEARTSYMTTTTAPTFGSFLRQTCRKNAGDYDVQVDTTFFPTHMRVGHSITRLADNGAIDVVLSIPLRQTAVVEYYTPALVKTTVWDRPTATAAGSPLPSACRYIHVKWAAWSTGLLIVPRRGRVITGAKVVAGGSDPSSYSYRQPDQDRSILIYLADDATETTQVHLTLDYILTDGTDGDAETKFASLTSLRSYSSSGEQSWR